MYDYGRQASKQRRGWLVGWLVDWDGDFQQAFLGVLSGLDFGDWVGGFDGIGDTEPEVLIPHTPFWALDLEIAGWDVVWSDVGFPFSPFFLFIPMIHPRSLSL